VSDPVKIAKDVGYVLLGTAVLRIQAVQVRRREIEAAVASGLDQVGALLPEPLRALVRR